MVLDKIEDFIDWIRDNIPRLTPTDWIQGLWGALASYSILNIPWTFVPPFKRVFFATVVVIGILCLMGALKGIFDIEFILHLFANSLIALGIAGFVGYIVLQKPSNVCAMVFTVALIGAFFIDMRSKILD